MNFRIIPFALALPLMLQACASYHRSEEVTEQMARTQVLIQQADRSGVAVNSLPELQAAKGKYAEAQKELEKKNREGDQKALQLAKQAELDTQFATAKAKSETQQAAALDAQKGVQDLRQEADRKAPVTPTATP
jgi:LAS superfamily LD-carboxypeptidase LdcB